MPITALPQHTAQAIGSTSVITDPCSIVKELLDNALDASASSVFVEISQNTVDVIQVKDNGHGISSEDHAVVCKRAFTSKIETINDLKNIGGSSLGFRGEALASAAEMSGGLTVATRVASAMVGSSVKYGRDGEMISSQRVSHPTGTSVRITDFLKYIPVRRQSVLKSSGKVLSKIKKLLQAYAMCHPTKRLSLKVLKAKTEGNNFIYTGGPNANPMDAALKIAGTDVAANCTIKEWPSDVSDGGYKLTALLAKHGSDSTSVDNAGQYISVDGRPLASGRGIARDITKMYKAHFRSTKSNDKDSTAVNDLFLCLQIQCPPGSYDVNIEPAKDDVLFEDPQQMLSLVKELFCNVYGDSIEPTEGNKSTNKGKEKTTYSDGFELLMARKSPSPSAAQPPPIIPPEIFEKPCSNKPRNYLSRAWSRDYYSQEDRTAERDLEALNPWSVTKLTAPFRTPVKTRAGPSTVPVLMHTTQRQSNATRAHNQISTASLSNSAAPSPSVSNAIPNSASTSPINSCRSPLVEHPSQASPTPSAQSILRRQRERDRERYGNGALDTWFQRITQPNLDQSEETEPESEAGPSLTQLAQERFGSPDPTPCDSLDDTEDIFTQNSIEDTQVTPAPSQSLAQELESRKETNRPHQVTNRRQEMPVLERWSASLHQLENEENPDLDQALDFEHRKREAMLKRREERRNQVPPSSSAKSPHHSRYISARAALNNNGGENQASAASDVFSKSTLDPFDPRSYLMRQNDQQIPPDEGKARRVQTSKLPLEKIPEDQNLYDVCLSLPLQNELLSNAVAENMKYDLYTQCGTEAEAFSASYPESVDLWKYRLSDLVSKHYETESSLDYDFSAILDLHGSN